MYTMRTDFFNVLKLKDDHIISSPPPILPPTPPKVTSLDCQFDTLRKKDPHSIEEMPPFYWPKVMSVKHFLE